MLLLTQAASTTCTSAAANTSSQRQCLCTGAESFEATSYHVQQTVQQIVQAFEVTPYEVRATSISTSVYALALEFEATSYPVQQLYNTLYRSFGVTSYPVLRAIRQLRTGLWMQHFASHEFTLEGSSELCYLAPQVRCVYWIDHDIG